MKIFLGSDHRGLDLKRALLGKPSDSLELVDLGATSLDPEDDYNDYAVAVARAVLAEPGSFGVLICGSAHGVAIQANRFRGIRAICGYNVDLARLGREHNDANILCLDSDFLSPESAHSILETFLGAKFLATEKYVRRNKKLDEEY